MFNCRQLILLGLCLGLSFSAFAEQANTKKAMLNAISKDINLIDTSCITVEEHKNNTPEEEAQNTESINPILRQLEKKCRKNKELLENLKFDIENTRDEGLNQFITDILLMPQRYRNKYPLPFMYLPLAGENILPMIKEAYGNMPLNSKISVLKAIMKMPLTKKAIPIIAMAINSPDGAESLFAQRAAIYEMQSKAIPYLKKALNQNRSTSYIKETLRNISSIDRKTACTIFFKYVSQNILPVRSIHEIFTYPYKECGPYLDNAIELLISKTEKKDDLYIALTDLEDIDAFLTLSTDTENNGFIKDIWGYVDANNLSAIIDAKTSIELSFDDELAIQTAFNNIIADNTLFIKHADAFLSSEGKIKEILDNLLKDKVYFKEGANKWQIKKILTEDQIEKIREMNFLMTERMFPGVIYARKGRYLDRKISASLLCSVSTKTGFFKLTPIMDKIFACAYDMDNFSSDIWDKYECQGLINRIIDTLSSSEILSLKNKIKNKYSSGISLILQKSAEDKREDSKFSFRDFAVECRFTFDNEENRTYTFPIVLQEKTYILSDKIAFAATPTVNTDNWHLDIVINTNLSALDIDMPFYTSREISIDEHKIKIDFLEFIDISSSKLYKR